MKPILKLILVTPLLFIALSSNCQNWKLSKEKDGILVYTAETESSYKMFKAEMTIDANLHGLIYLLKDAESIPKWMYKVDEFEIFTEANEKHWLSWSGVDMPWPVDDRDVVSWQVLRKSKYGYIIEVSSLPDKMKRRDDYVRLRVSQGFWMFEKKNNGQVKVTYQFQAEPDGIPAWVVNIFIVDSPYNTLRNMRDLVKEQPYNSIKLTYLD